MTSPSRWNHLGRMRKCGLVGDRESLEHQEFSVGAMVHTERARKSGDGAFRMTTNPGHPET